ncbi:MAG: oligoendopeptidase F [Bacilli bacterium]|nr:oligoendopeptidase F [Bacilli bacterium]
MNKWDFSLVYQNEKDYLDDFNFVNESLTKLGEFKGKLNSKENIKNYFILDEKVSAKLVKVYVYNAMKYDLNQKNTSSQAEFGKAFSLYMDYVSATSFVSSELINNKLETLLSFTKEDDFLKNYDYYFNKTFTLKEHILDSKSEEIIANYQNALQNYSNLYDALANADNFEKEVKLSDGTMLKVNEANYRYYLETLSNQEDRRIVFESIFKYYEGHKNTFAGIYNGLILAGIAEMKNRKYDNILDVYLKTNKIPTSVYTSLIDTVRENVSVLHRYYELRKKYFKLDNLHTYDRFLKFASSNEEFSYDYSKELFLKSVNSLSEEFVNKAKYVISEGRIDVYPSDGKQTGAYSNGIYDCGPFILLNHNNTLDAAFTLAHEAGHSIHTSFANENQPLVKSDYPIFIAEIASTFNEQLFLDYLMKQDIDVKSKIVLLQSAIDGLIGTFYRQTLFADYEYQAFNKKISGETITYELLSNIMKDLYKTYYGIDLNEELYKEYVWAYIPHFFHTPFYVYQYATSFAASLLIYENVKDNVPNAFENYLKLLKAGGSDFPVELVKKAGVDLTSKEPFLAVVKRLNDLLDMLEDTLKVYNK